MAAKPGYYYPLGDGESAESWTALEQLMRHLRGAPPLGGMAGNAG